MKEEKLSRKNFITLAMRFGVTMAGGALLLAGCNSNGPDNTKNLPVQSDSSLQGSETAAQPASCNDVSGLTAEEVNKRKSLGFVEQAPSEDVRCEVCKLYLPPSEGESCGSCSLFKGFVDKGASCTYFAPLEA